MNCKWLHRSLKLIMQVKPCGNEDSKSVHRSVSICCPKCEKPRDERRRDMALARVPESTPGARVRVMFVEYYRSSIDEDVRVIDPARSRVPERLVLRRVGSHATG